MFELEVPEDVEERHDGAVATVMSGAAVPGVEAVAPTEDVFREIGRGGGGIRPEWLASFVGRASVRVGTEPTGGRWEDDEGVGGG